MTAGTRANFSALTATQPYMSISTALDAFPQYLLVFLWLPVRSKGAE